MYIFAYTQLNNMYKIGLLYCKYGQSLEKEMYNNGMCVNSSVRVYVFLCMYMCVCACSIYVCAFVYTHARVYMCVYCLYLQYHSKVTLHSLALLL